jgi:hypothetical protein
MRKGPQMTTVIVASLIVSGIALSAFATLVVGVRRTDRNLSLRDSSADGYADAFARRVLGVGVRQPETSACRETEAVCNDRAGR